MLVLRKPTAIVRSCNSFGSNHPDYKAWKEAGFTSFALRADDPFAARAAEDARAAQATVCAVVQYNGESRADFVAKVRKGKQALAADATIIEPEHDGGLMPFQLQAGVFHDLRFALGHEDVAPLALYVPPLKGTWPGALEIDYGAAADQAMFIIVELYGKTNDVVLPPARCVGAIMAWFNEPAHRFQGIGVRRIVPVVSAGQAAYFKPRIAGTGTRGLFYWTADDDQHADDAAKYKPLFGPQSVEFAAWTS